ALLTTDNRQDCGDYGAPAPWFGAAPEALLQGLALLPDLEVHVLSCTQQLVAAPPKLAPNVFFHSLLVPKLGWARTGFQGCIRAVRRELKVIQPDIVHGQGTERDCALSAVFSGFPNVLTVHGNVRRVAQVTRARAFSYWWVAARLETLALRRACGVFCNSEYTEQLVRPYGRRTWRVPNALRTRFFTAAREPAQTGCLLLNVGFIGPRKRQLELLDRLQELHQQGVKLECRFIGSAQPHTRYVRAFLEKLKPLEQAGVARYVGLKPLNELIALFDSSAALIHMPMEEAFGLVVAEALARGLKVFASRVGGIPDITAGVQDAELFQADDWRGLNAAIGRWACAGCPRPGQARDLMRGRYHPEVIARRHVEIYKEVLRHA
ncbi:MAG TPA: glycosyltransferase family 4 protein, partial [bacterium]|nr:glycosyltransferase family 4 protein [bacterium]